MILVTGGSGFVGRALLPALIGRGHQLCVLTRNPAALAGLDPAVRLRQGDVLDTGSLMTALEGVESVIHLAAAVPGRGMTAAQFRRVNVEGTRNVACAAARQGVTRFILGSSAGVYGDGTGSEPIPEITAPAPVTQYQRSKLEAENVTRVALSGTRVQWNILRPGITYGPGSSSTVKLLQTLRRRRIWIHGPATLLLRPAYVDDVVNVLVAMLTSPGPVGEVINVGGERVLSYQDYLGVLSTRMGITITQLRTPQTVRSAVAVPLAQCLRSLGVSVPYLLQRMERRYINLAPDIEKARRELGYRPVTLEEGIDATVRCAEQQRIL